MIGDSCLSGSKVKGYFCDNFHKFSPIRRNFQAIFAGFVSFPAK